MNRPRVRTIDEAAFDAARCFCASKIEENHFDETNAARGLLLLAHFGKEDVPESVISKISQEAPTEMIGTTRSRVSFFMNRFRKLGLSI